MKNWVIAENLSKIPAVENGYGCCYAVKIPIIQGVCLIKIGATTEPKVRLQNLRKKGTIFLCISTTFELLGKRRNIA